jgi:HAD superfamily hydrolase (TIGR01509 family)
VALVCESNRRPELVSALWELFGEKKRLFSERIVASVPMPAAVRELLFELALPLAVVSTSFRAEVEPALISAGVRDRFAAIVCGEDVENLKPHPEPYRTAARLLGAAHPLVVEDSDTGAAAGRAAGYQVVRIARPAETPLRVRNALGRVISPQEL